MSCCTVDGFSIENEHYHFLNQPYSLLLHSNLLNIVSPENTLSMKYIIMFPLLCLSLLLSGQWEMIYENNAAGEAISGNKEQLIEAVRVGKELRIGWIYLDDESGKNRIEKFADIEVITILKGDEVFAQLRPMKSEFTKDKKDVIRFNGTVSVYLFSTTNQQLRYRLREGETGRGAESKLRSVDKIQWFVKD